MVQVTVDEPSFSHALNHGNSVSVPSGEVWKVTIGGGIAVNPNTDNYATIAELNGVPIASYLNDSTSHSSNSFNLDAVITAGDTISSVENAQSHNGGVIVSGQDVSSTVDNVPVTHELDHGQSVSVPSGETWEVTIGGGLNINPNEGGDVDTYAELNGVPIASYVSDKTSHSTSSFPLKAVLVGGDTIDCHSAGDGHNGGIIVSGFKV